MKTIRGFIALIAGAVPLLASAETPTATEKADALQWVTAKFEGVEKKPTYSAFLRVLANHDPLQLNNRNGRPMRLGDRTYERGLYCHAVSKIEVKLPKPGKTFTATAGVDNNENTSGNRGSVTFSVTVNGKKAFDSGLLRSNSAAVPVRVDLGGATEFTLEVGDGGDGIPCDQADWADANVALDDGAALWLGDLPIEGDGGCGTDPFFSFAYEGKPSAELLKTWNVERDSRKLDDARTERTITYTDPKTGLRVRCVGTEYQDFPAVEWTLYFKNSGTQDTPILESVQALDTRLGGFDRATLYWSTGGVATFDDFAPQEKPFKKPGETLHFQPGGGRSSNGVLPFFNVLGPQGGMIAAVGWTGEWAADFTATNAGLALNAGLAKTHLLLHPGEEIRTPKILLLFYRGGDRWHGQNLLRRFILAHHRPLVNGKPMSAPITWGVFGSTPADVHLHNIGKIIEHNLPLDYYWIDAAWYGSGLTQNWYSEAGSWDVATKRISPRLQAAER